MLLENVSFFLLTFLEVLILSAAYLVFAVKSPVHAALFLILTFCLSAIWLLFNGAEFLAVLLMVLYVGAIAVLFLFVLMLLSSPRDIFKESQ
jgi:NADH-quinone oxidoreductase subunit J